MNYIVQIYVDSSDEAAMDDVDMSSESDDNWEEISDEDVQNEQDEEDIKSVESENDHNMDNSGFMSA